MKVKGTILFVLVGAIALIALSWFQKQEKAVQLSIEDEARKLEEERKELLTDSSRFKGKITIGLDNYLGYYPLRSKHMQREMLQDGFPMEVKDDGADYAERIKLIESGELDFAVFTVDSYILNAAPNFSGQIVMILSESQGADAIVVNKAINKVNDIKSITTEALQSLLAGETEAAVLWEPDVSTALKDDRFKVLISTESTSNLIVDILVASDNVINNEPEKLEALMKSYFPTLRYFQKNRDRLSKEFQADASLSASDADRVIDSIAWKSLRQNASSWFGLRSNSVPRPEFKIIETINLTNDVLTKFGDFDESPLPSAGAFQLLSSKHLASLHERLVSGQQLDIEETFFEQLSPKEWASLDSVASLEIPPIKFKPGTRDFSEEGKLSIKDIKNMLMRYPRYRLKIEGHTSNKGEAALNKELSQDRANSIRNYLIDQYKLPANRIKAEGVGSERPLERKPGMSYRAWLNKLPRVEFHLLEEVL